MHLEPTQESVMEVMSRLSDRPFIMLNLFRLREVPDYSIYPELEPSTPQSSRELLYRYIGEMDAHLDAAGAKRIFLGDGGLCLIGPPGERWDVVQMVSYPSLESFVALSTADATRADVPRRAVMVEDSRIMPMFAQSLDAARAG